MTTMRFATASLLALFIFAVGSFAPPADAARPHSGNNNPGQDSNVGPDNNPGRDNSPGFNNKSSNEDEGLGSAQGEIEQIITPEYRRRGMRVERLNDGSLKLLLPSEVLFAYDSADISPAFAPTLRQVARIMSNRPRLQARILGHTDSNGSDSYNLDLSLRRAESVTVALSSQGVERFRLHAEGRGEQEPIASNATAEGQQLNRRVEIILYRKRGDRPRRNQP